MCSASGVCQVSASDLPEEASAAAAAGQDGAKPEFSMEVTAELGEAALFIGGRAPPVWWPPQVRLPAEERLPPELVPADRGVVLDPCWA